MLLMLPVDPPVAITDLSNHIEQPAADKPSSAVKITNKQLNLPKQVSVDEQGDVTKTDTDVTPDSAPIAVPVLYSSKDDQGKQTEPADRPVPVLYNTKDDQSEQTDQAGRPVPVLYNTKDDQPKPTDRPVPVLYNKVLDDIHIDADNHTKIPEVKPTEDIPPVIGSLCNKTATNCSQDILSNPAAPAPTGEYGGHTSAPPPDIQQSHPAPTGEYGGHGTSAPPADPTGEYGGHSTSAPPAIQQSHVAQFVTVPEKSFLFDLRVTSLAWTPSLGNSSSEEYVTMETRCHDMMLPLFQELPGFLALKILGFKRGSIIVEHKALFDYTRVTSSEELSSRLRGAVEGGRLDPNMTFDSLTVYDDAAIDLCDFAQCEAHSRCVAPPGAQVPLCRCDAGYGSVGGAACTSRCELEPGFCRNDGRCDVQPGLGVICRCRAGASWWHAGLRCETYMSYFMVFSIGGGAVGGVFVIMLLCLILVAKKVPNKTRPHTYYPSPYRRPFFMEAPVPGVSGPAETTWKENPMFIDEQEEDIYSTISRKAGQEISRELRELEASDIEDPYGIIGMFTKAESISTSGAKLPPGDWNGVVRFKPTVECIDPNWKFKIKRPRYAFNPEYEQQRDDLSWP
ncbi:uncharacterized protein LOC144886290 [Branchiostoma floridae x Branchiostoma japonicum]